MDSGSHQSGSGRRSVLVVEDEPIVRALAAEFLQDSGYETLEAAIPAEAIEVLNRISVDVVVSDIRMPGDEDGLDLAFWIRTNRPEIKIVLTSGYTMVSELREEFCDAPLLRKPYPMDQLLDRVRTALK